MRILYYTSIVNETFLSLPVMRAAASFPVAVAVSYGNSSSAATSSAPMISAFLLVASFVWRGADDFTSGFAADADVVALAAAVNGVPC